MNFPVWTEVFHFIHLLYRGVYWIVISTSYSVDQTCDLARPHEHTYSWKLLWRDMFLWICPRWSKFQHRNTRMLEFADGIRLGFTQKISGLFNVILPRRASLQSRTIIESIWFGYIPHCSRIRNGDEKLLGFALNFSDLTKEGTICLDLRFRRPWNLQLLDKHGTLVNTYIQSNHPQTAVPQSGCHSVSKDTYSEHTTCRRKESVLSKTRFSRPAMTPKVRKTVVKPTQNGRKCCKMVGKRPDNRPGLMSFWPH